MKRSLGIFGMPALLMVPQVAGAEAGSAFSDI